MQRIRTRLGHAALAAAVLFAGGCAGSTRIDPSPELLRGDWIGDAKIIVTWCEQDRVAVSLAIAPDGRVEGTIGDAKLRQAYLAWNRGALGRQLDIKSDYIVRGELEGALVAQEGIERDSVFLPFDTETRELGELVLVGGVATSGSKFGGRDEMILSASGLVLRRPPKTFAEGR